jgi:hypothetical protein
MQSSWRMILRSFYSIRSITSKRVEIVDSATAFAGSNDF